MFIVHGKNLDDMIGIYRIFQVLPTLPLFRQRERERDEREERQRETIFSVLPLTTLCMAEQPKKRKVEGKYEQDGEGRRACQ